MEIMFIIDQVASALGLTDTQLGVTLVVVSMISGLVSRIIPDDQTGVLGIVRKIATVIGLQASNRITKGVSVNRVAREVAQVSDFEEGIVPPQGLIGIPVIASTVLEHLNLEEKIADAIEKELKKINPFRKRPAAKKPPVGK